MKYRLMDILACPICKHFPLKLCVFNENKYGYTIDFKDKILCEEYCALKENFIKNLDPSTLDCATCLEREVSEGILVCENCGRWYPIIDEIPHMLPDDLRDRDEDLKFLKKFEDRIPTTVLNSGLPWNLMEK